MFVGTKKQTQDAVRDQAVRCGMPYVNHRWLGGLLTNWVTMADRIRRLHELRRQKIEGQLDLLPTRERLSAEAELLKLETNLGGVADMQRLPDAVVVVDLKQRGHRRARGEPPRHPGDRPGRHQLRPGRGDVRDPRQRRRDPLVQPDPRRHRPGIADGRGYVARRPRPAGGPGRGRRTGRSRCGRGSRARGRGRPGAPGAGRSRSGRGGRPAPVEPAPAAEAPAPARSGGPAPRPRRPAPAAPAPEAAPEPAAEAHRPHRRGRRRDSRRNGGEHVPLRDNGEGAPRDDRRRDDGLQEGAGRIRGDMEPATELLRAKGWPTPPSGRAARPTRASSTATSTRVGASAC